MWDGAVNHLDVQALAPISNHLEMDEKIENVVDKLQRNKLYRKLFFDAYGDSLVTGEYTLKAISQFMLTLISSNAKYDSVMLGKAKFTEQEKKGYSLFKKNCSACHPEPLFTNASFENNGLPVDTTLNDIGRIAITHNSNDSLKFKVPTLRNTEFSQPYMHDGRFKKLQEVLKHYVFGVTKSKTLSSHLIKPIMLKPSEQIDIIAFLYTLTDKKFLFNQRYSYPKKIFSKGAKD
jgi:cytochrome c peroxidase